MPYFDLADYDQYTHLVQLFLAAHPARREVNEAIRAQEGKPAEYFFSSDMMREIAAWAQGRHLITRKDAARLVELAIESFADPGSIVSLTARVLGDPPRLQPTVLSTEMQHWLTLSAPVLEPGDTVEALTIPAAIALLDAMAVDPEFGPGAQARAKQLIAWLQAQRGDVQQTPVI